MPPMTGLVDLVRRRIAVKLTLTLVGFVALSMIAAGVYLNRALEAFAVDALESRLVTAGRLLHDEAGAARARPRLHRARGGADGRARDRHRPRRARAG